VLPEGDVSRAEKVAYIDVAAGLGVGLLKWFLTRTAARKVKTAFTETERAAGKSKLL
jgi:hypothetical protein